MALQPTTQCAKRNPPLKFVSENKRRITTILQVKYHEYCVGKRVKQVERPVLIALTAIIQTASKTNRDCPRDSIQCWWEELAADNELPAWSVDLNTAARSILARYKIIGIDHKRWQYVPDAKGQCKGIWIREQELVGERNYSYPTPVYYSLFLYLPLHKGYDADV